ncbi:MAG: hypothetical protein IJA12_06960 [Oscillospiraceae bacterium]|nr:hypothetical protein [Oscillospiraceae bacterium]
MKLKNTLAVLTAAVCSVSAVMTYGITSGVAEETIKIMSIGDSITDGYGTDGSYRKFLYHNLTESGYSIDMVGPNWSWGDATYSDSTTGDNFTYDAAHCGYSGYAIKEYSGRSGILETIQSGNYLSQYTPDIVILQIGTNDVIDNHEIDSAGERLDVLASYILENISSDSALFITTIPDLEPNRADVYSWFGNYRHSADWQTYYSDEEAAAYVKQQIDNYNAQVKKLVEEKQAAGVSNIYYGNVNSAVTDVTTQLKDGVHPNDVGYKLMGEYWTGVIGAYLSGETPEVTEPSTEPTPEPTTETQPSSEATDPTEPSTEETQPTSEVTDPTEPSTEETQPSSEVTDPTEPSTEETQPSSEVTDPTEPSTEETQPTYEPDSDKGDVNLNGSVTVADAALLSKFLVGNDNLSPAMLKRADLNDDGKVNIFDRILLIKKIIG